MSWKLVTTVSLDRRTRKLLARHPDLRPRFADTLEKLPTDPFAPGLRLHPLTGKLQGMQAVCRRRRESGAKLTIRKRLRLYWWRGVIRANW
jgi:hypothetical protein